jgi:tetratricopeptide (TPR) repeat protein
MFSSSSPQGKSSVEQQLDLLQSLRKAKKFKEADEAGENALRLFPGNKQILSVHCDTALRAKNIGSAIKRLNQLLSLSISPRSQDHTLLRLVDIYVNLGQPTEAELHVARALETRPDSLALLKAKAELALLLPGGASNPDAWRRLASAPELKSADDEWRVKTIAACVAGLRLAGCAGEARDLLAAHYRPKDEAWTEHLTDGFAKLVIFNNGATRLEFLTKLFDPATRAIMEASRLAVTFDSMEQTWDKESFAYRPLSPRNWDLLAVRKRTKEDFHQEFTRVEFLRVAKPIAAFYQDVVALGQSLGAYCALYYASWIPGCRILATAPRNPLNPKYSGKRYANHRLFRHEYDMPVNAGSAPTIVYDPKNSEDGRYVATSLKVRFPNAKLVFYPYCGHSITRYLRDVGVLKNATLGFCEGIPFPEFNPCLRGESAEYLRNVGKLTLAAGRLRWARALVTRALELKQDPERSEALLEAIRAAEAARKSARH